MSFSLVVLRSWVSILGPQNAARRGPEPLRVMFSAPHPQLLNYTHFLTSLFHQVSWALGALSAGRGGTQLPEEQRGPPTGCPGRLLELKGMAGLDSGGRGASPCFRAWEADH